jgi:hypothetical protein
LLFQYEKTENSGNTAQQCISFAAGGHYAVFPYLLFSKLNLATIKQRNL